MRKKERAKKGTRQTRQSKTNNKSPSSNDKGKHAVRLKCGPLRINILRLFVWEKWSPSPWEMHLSQELEAHGILQGGLGLHTLVKRGLSQALTQGITNSFCYSAFVWMVPPCHHPKKNAPKRGHTHKHFETEPWTYFKNEWKSSKTASHPGHLQTP